MKNKKISDIKLFFISLFGLSIIALVYQYHINLYEFLIFIVLSIIVCLWSNFLRD